MNIAHPYLAPCNTIDLHRFDLIFQQIHISHYAATIASQFIMSVMNIYSEIYREYTEKIFQRNSRVKRMIWIILLSLGADLGEG